MALYSPNTRISGESITAVKYMADHQVHADSQTTLLTEDYSATTTQMQATTDPGEVGTESLPTTLAGELERLRFAIKEAKGTAQWYETRPGVVVLARDVSTTTINNTAVETTVFTTSIPANALSTNRSLRLKGQGDYSNVSGANQNFTMKVTLATTTYLSVTESVPSAANSRALRFEVDITANNLASAQYGNGVFYVGASASATGTARTPTSHALATRETTFDMSAARTVTVTFQHGAASGTIQATARTVSLELMVS